MKKCEILIPHACRSDEALTKPMIEKISELDWVDCWEIPLTPANFIESYQSVESFLKIHPVDLVYLSGDRTEMYGACVAAFHNNVPIAIYGSGITNTIATYDDINRHSMALMADICLCEDLYSGKTTVLLLKTIRENKRKLEKYFPENIHIVGNMYLEGLTETDESLVPDEPYVLVLMNPETITLKDYIFKKDDHVKYIFIGSNPDGQCFSNRTYDNLPRSQFLGLMKRCERFITNSSCAYYEAPAFLKPEQIIKVGERNKGRSTPTEWKQEYKTSERIIEILEKWWSKYFKNKEELK